MVRGRRKTGIFFAPAGTLAAILVAAAFTRAGGAAPVPSPPRGWLGVYQEPAASLPKIRPEAGGEPALRGAKSGIRVTAVFPDSPADAAGLREGDLLLGIDGEVFAGVAESTRLAYQHGMEKLRPGDRCTFLVLRDGVERTLDRSGQPAGAPEESDFWRQPSLLVDSLKYGEKLAATAERRQKIFELAVVLGDRPEAAWPPGPSDRQIDPQVKYRESDFTPAIWSLVDRFRIREDTEDLLARLARCEETVDPHRLPCFILGHRHPFRLEALARDLSERFKGDGGPEEVLEAARTVLAPGSAPLPNEPGRVAAPRSRSALAGHGLRDDAAVGRWGNMRGYERGYPPAHPPRILHPSERARIMAPLLDDIERRFGRAEALRRQAFASLTAEEQDFLRHHIYDLSDAFTSEIYIHFDADRARFARNKRIISLATRVDQAALLASARCLAVLASPAWVAQAVRTITQAYADTLGAEILLEKRTPYGKILIGGTGRHWYRDTDAAFILDLGGDDFYTGNNGGSSPEAPLAVCIDAAGNDSYESTTKSCQGAGVLGVGILLDMSGNDEYVGNQWCQGTGYFGVGWLEDLAGDDTYRGRTFCQGVGLFGLGFLLDDAGCDRYEGDAKVQGVGLAHGVGALLDRAGDDSYYAKGLYPTNYGDAGIFDSWSQGCGIGFRTLASGGLGLLLDGGGSDRMEAGNFSQGGGYYYGAGILRAFGPENDTYIGSRYNQGFCAHEAWGVFLEDGGDDTYTTRQAVAQGLAWDECATLFIDEAGNDRYEGGGGFSQGASAHNAVCIFLDRGGRDTYDYPPGQALAGPNDYHGGASLSVFADEMGGKDAYNSKLSGNDRVLCRPGHGLFLDLRGRLGSKQGGLGR